MELAVRKDGDVTFLTASGHFETVTLPTFSETETVELTYTGTLTAAGRGASRVPVKKFSLYCLAAGNRRRASLSFVIDEQGGGGWA